MMKVYMYNYKQTYVNYYDEQGAPVGFERSISKNSCKDAPYLAVCNLVSVAFTRLWLGSYSYNLLSIQYTWYLCTQDNDITRYKKNTRDQ